MEWMMHATTWSPSSYEMRIGWTIRSISNTSYRSHSSLFTRCEKSKKILDAGKNTLREGVIPVTSGVHSYSCPPFLGIARVTKHETIYMAKHFSKRWWNKGETHNFLFTPLFFSIALLTYCRTERKKIQLGSNLSPSSYAACFQVIFGLALRHRTKRK